MPDALTSPARGYLDTPTLGLPTPESLVAIRGAIDEWAGGRPDYVRWEGSLDSCRQDFASLCGVAPQQVGLVPSVVPAVSAAAARLDRGGKVVAHSSEFRSLLLPVLATVGADRMRWVEGPYVAETFVAAIDRDAEAVLVSSASSHDGGRPRLSTLVSACDAVGARLLVDGTQTAGIVDLDVRVDELSLFACAGYKGLRGPRGTGYAVMDDSLATLATARSPYGSADAAEHGSYGPPVCPKGGAAGLDQSPAWFSWVGAAPALALLVKGKRNLGPTPTTLSDRLRDRLAELGLAAQPTDLPSPIVSFEVDDPAGTLGRLHQAGIRAAVRAGRVRMGFHTYNDDRDVEAVCDSLRGSRHHRRTKESQS